MEISNKSGLLRRLKMNATYIQRLGFQKVQCILDKRDINRDYFCKHWMNTMLVLKNLFLDIKKPKIEFLLIVRKVQILCLT